MSSALLHFLAALATDPDLMKLYLEKPEAAVKKYELPEDVAALILSKKAGAIEQAVRAALTESSTEGDPGRFSITLSGFLPPPPTTSSPVSHRVFASGIVAVVPLGATPADEIPGISLLLGGPPPPTQGPVSHHVTPAITRRQDAPLGASPPAASGSKTPPVPPEGPHY
jgi:hypothetical protein